MTPLIVVAGVTLSAKVIGYVCGELSEKEEIERKKLEADGAKYKEELDKLKKKRKKLSEEGLQEALTIQRQYIFKIDESIKERIQEYGELKEDDIKFGEGEQRFFRAIFEIFSQSEDINNLKNNKWELYDLQDREKLWNIIEDMLEGNDSWFVKELGWWGRHWDVENYLMEKIFVPHLYRIRKNLSKLKLVTLIISSLPIILLHSCSYSGTAL